MNFEEIKFKLSRIDSKTLGALAVLALSIFIVIVAIVASCVSTYAAKTEREEFLKTALTCKGTVTRCSMAIDEEDRMVGYDMDFDYAVDGETHHAKDVIVKTDYSVGDKITVYYDPNTPTRFTIDEGEESEEYKMYRTGRTIEVVGLILLVAFVALYSYIRRAVRR